MASKNSKGFWNSRIGTVIGEGGVLLVIGAGLGLAIGAIFGTIRQDYSTLLYFVIGTPVILISHLGIRSFLDKHLTTYKKNHARPPFYKDSTILGDVIDWAFITAFMTFVMSVNNHRFWLIPLGIIFSTVVIGIGGLVERRSYWRKRTQPRDGGNGSADTANDDDDDDDEIQMPYYTPEIWA
jgi:hypothetical protein